MLMKLRTNLDGVIAEEAIPRRQGVAQMRPRPTVSLSGAVGIRPHPRVRTRSSILPGGDRGSGGVRGCLACSREGDDPREPLR